MNASGGKLAWVLGAGASGQAAAALLRTEGCRVVILDEADGSQLLQGIPDLAVVSPGFASDHSWLNQLRDRGVGLTSEAELGLSRLRGPVLAVTGSLGKTSMVHLAAAVASEAGQQVTLSGNMGTPVCEIAAVQPEADLHVVELSSFQLELFRSFEPDVGVLLNLFPNHLDRHGTMDRYREAKQRLFRGRGVAVVPAGSQLSGFAGERREHGANACWEWNPGQILREGRKVLSLPSGTLNQPGFGDNVAAMCAGLDALGFEPEQILAGIELFSPLPHRQERVPLRSAWSAINDSKSTCLSATKAAVSGTEGGEGHLHLIAGGLGKGEDWESMQDVLTSSRPSVYLMGAGAEEMKKVWTRWLSYCENHVTLSACVQAAWKRCRPGDTVLLSPGCASFDQFRNFEERGDKFRQLVQDLDRREQPI